MNRCLPFTKVIGGRWNPLYPPPKAKISVREHTGREILSICNFKCNQHISLASKNAALQGNEKHSLQEIFSSEPSSYRLGPACSWDVCFESHILFQIISSPSPVVPSQDLLYMHYGKIGHLNLGISNYSTQSYFFFSGVGYEKKSIAICAVVLDYVRKHHRSIYEEINSTFSADLLCNEKCLETSHWLLIMQMKNNLTIKTIKTTFQYP